MFPITEAAVRRGLESVEWPGRFEIVLEQPTVILDGAHNGEGVNALVAALEDSRQARKVRLLFASMEDKNWRLMLNTLASVVDEIVLTRVDMERSADPYPLARHLAGKVSHRVVENSRAALRSLLEAAQSDDIVVVAGSLYLLGEIRSTLLEIKQTKAAGHA